MSAAAMSQAESGNRQIVLDNWGRHNYTTHSNEARPDTSMTLGLNQSERAATMTDRARDSRQRRRKAVAAATVAAYLLVTVAIGLFHQGGSEPLHHSLLFQCLAGEGVRPPCDDCKADGESWRSPKGHGHDHGACLVCQLLQARSHRTTELVAYSPALPPCARHLPCPPVRIPNPLARSHLGRSPPTLA